MLELLIREGYSTDYIDYLIVTDIDYNCEVGLYEQGFSKKVKKILNKYFEDYETDIGCNHWGNKELSVTIYDREYIDHFYGNDEEEAFRTVSLQFGYTY